ncbi:2-nitropropane dioxygenase [Xylogone sp. PMI_703]|nr:2-nitropropane dioxygenase [Xylogone sp. PMI_703]
MTSITSLSRSLKSQYPWISSPLICSGPMRLIATENLATAVTLAGGIGFLGVGTDTSTLQPLLSSATTVLEKASAKLAAPGVLPVGVGFICWGADLEAAVSAIKSTKLKPCAAWLFAPKEINHLGSWASGIREASNGLSKIWVQVGTVKDALDVAKICRPDALVIQGSDAGGHGLARSSSLISLLPECADALKKAGFGDIPLIAAGGIVDGRGVAAAFTLGASGVGMGTRFLASPEAMISNGYKKALIDASDGGAITARTSVYDQLRGTTGWPSRYNARGVLNKSFWDSENGMSEDENKKLYKEAIKLGDAGWGAEGRMTTYAGTGVGLINRIIPAADIVKEVSADCKHILGRVASKL